MMVLAKLALDTEKTLNRIAAATGCRPTSVDGYALKLFAAVPRHPLAYPAGRGAGRYVNLGNCSLRVLRLLDGIVARYGVGITAVVEAALSDFALAKVNAVTEDELKVPYSR